MILRPYQETFVDEIRYGFLEVDSICLQSPCGSGKGTTYAYITHNATAKGNKVVFGVHGRHLVHDMSERLDVLGLDHGVIMGDHHRRKPWLPTQVTSIDTLARRERLPEAHLFLIDECRFALSPTWKKVVQAYKAQGAKILGMDATPCRMDGKGLGDLFDRLIIGPQPQELIDQGFLVPSEVYWPAGGEETRAVRNVKKIGGEYNARAQAAIVDKPKLIGDLVKEWEARGRDDKTFVFGVHQQHAKDIAERFRMAGHDFAYMDSDTPDVERKQIWRDYDHGSLNGIVNIRVLGYGVDHPITSCIVDAAATGSLSNHIQKWGRASRPYKLKKRFIVIDHYGNVGEHGMYEQPREWSLEGAPKRQKGDDEIVPAISRCTSCFRPFRYGPDRCPYCGTPIEKKTVKVIEVAGQLKKFEPKLLTAEQWQHKLKEDRDRKAKFLELAELGSIKGYKPNWCKMRAKALFGRWPNREWVAEAQSKGWLPVKAEEEVMYG